MGAHMRAARVLVSPEPAAARMQKNKQTACHSCLLTSWASGMDW
jgi:hypothetical protein